MTVGDAWRTVVFEELHEVFDNTLNRQGRTERLADALARMVVENKRLKDELQALQLHHEATLVRLAKLEAMLEHSDDWRM
jgi:predicted nuclease with TOPRIM domain